MQSHNTTRHPFPRKSAPRRDENRVAGQIASRILIEKFWARVDKRGPDECWTWLGCLKNGYGRLEVHSRKLAAHRLSYTLHYGKIPDGLCCLHKCDNRACVNPNHLFLGTVADNNLDKKLKGRQSRGEAHGSAKLTAAQVGEIRRLANAGLGRRQLARQYAVSEYSIRDIIRRKNWAHVE